VAEVQLEDQEAQSIEPVVVILRWLARIFLVLVQL
jgi:hypothetical protein